MASFKSNNGHLLIYHGERDPSFSANCNVLNAIITVPDVQEYIRDIEAIVEFLCESWWSRKSKDKWVGICKITLWRGNVCL